MAKTKISEFSSTPANNTDIDSINIAEGCAPSGINDAIRELMAQLKDFQTGAQGDSFNGPIGTSTAAAGAFTTLSATGAITSTLATGTAPLVIASTTKVSNLNVDLLDGADWASPAALGSTTPAAVSATTLSASSTVTLSGGTANGVAYLNGSKVVTSGSALTFDGSFYLGLTGAMKINSAGYKLRFYDATGATGYGYFYTDGTNLQFDSGNTQPLSFLINGTEGMRLTSTGLGIGTSSPLAKLDVSKTATVSTTDPVGNNVPTIQASANTVSGKAMLQLTALSSAGARSPAYIEVGAVADYRSYMNLVYSADAGNAGYFAVSQFSPSGVSTTERMRIDVNGNLGLGVTPSAWGSTYRALQVGLTASLVGLTNDTKTHLSTNARFDGTDWRYIATSPASRYAQIDNQHQWFNAASGTAGNAISFTQAMSLLASGELLIGKTAISTSTAGLTLSNFSGTTGTVSCVKTSSGQSTAWGNFYSGTYVGGMEYTNTATIFAVSSDVRLKKNIADSQSASAKIDQIRIVSHGWKHDDEVVEFGTIAQELHAIAPQAVIKGDDNDVIEKTWAVDYSKLVPMLIKEVQELRQRVATLEAK